MDIIIKNCDVITGDEKTILEKAWVGIDKNKIVAVAQSEIPETLITDSPKILDAAGCYIIPGIINTHTHGCTLGPLYSSGAKPVSLRQALRNVDRHLLKGTTSLINVCGLGTKADTETINRTHPLKIYTGTAQFPSTFEAAKIIDASGIKEEHYAISAEDATKNGAIIVGEIGSGATLGGGVSEYKYIPEAIEKKTGISLSVEQVHLLKQAFINSGFFLKQEISSEISDLMQEYHLDKKISADKISEIIDFYTNKPVNIALQSFDEAFKFAEKHKLPVIFHHASTSAVKIYELAKKKKPDTIIIAAHSNHSSFTLDECINWAKKLKAEGVIIDVATINSISGYNRGSIENIKELLSGGLADIITTDYGGGVWDSIPGFIQYFYKRGLLDLKKGIHMVSGRISEILGSPFDETGIIKEGKTADIVILDKLNLGKVETVIIDGKIVADGGWCLYN